MGIDTSELSSPSEGSPGQNGLGVEEGLYQAVKDLDQPILSSCAWIGVMTNGDGSVVDWNGQDVLVTGIYPPLDPVASPQTRKFTKRETDALELWNDILTSGGGKLYLEDRITSIRYSKVRPDRQSSRSEVFLTTSSERLELHVVFHRELDQDNTTYFRAAHGGAKSSVETARE